ncbi:MAG: chorismate mutase [Candidatus Lambdaproteobacteria bacterium]|nr:chorismate mutase [Candidatus Lambdaproteobacteria bacterium]
MAENTARSSITAQRAEIDRIDAELIELFNRRAECALAIGRVKKANDEPVRVPAREQQVLERALSLNRGPLSADAIARLFRGLIEEMRRLEETPET